MRPIIVEGVPRSGTRFFAKFIETQFNIKIFRVQRSILKYYELLYKDERNEKDIKSLLYDMVNGYIFKSRVGIIDIDQLQLETNINNFPQVLDAIFSNQAKQSGYSGWGLKFDNPVGMQACIDLFPEAKYLHIIRDGRDTHLSSCYTINAGFHNPYHNAHLWKTLIEKRRSLSTLINENNYFEVYYETIISDPYNVFKKLQEFLHNLDAEYVNMNIKSSNAKKWHSKMRDRDVYIYECIAGDLLKSLGYNLKFVNHTNKGIKPKFFYSIYEILMVLFVYFKLFINRNERHRVTHKLKAKMSNIKSKF